MSFPYRILSKRALVSIGASLLMATSTVGVITAVTAPSAFAATAASTQFTFLIKDLNNLYTSLAANDPSGLTNLENFSSTVNASANSVTTFSGLSTWENILYSNTSGSALSAQTKAADTKKLAPLISFMITNFLTPSNLPNANSASGIATLKQNFATAVNNVSTSTSGAITGADLYSFYESFLLSAIKQLAQSSSSTASTGANSPLSVLFENALESAASSTPAFVGLLSEYGLQASDIPMIINNFETQFGATTVTGEIATLAQGLVNPQITSAGGALTANAGNYNVSINQAPITLTFSLSPQQGISSIFSTLPIPSSWISLAVTAGNSNLVTTKGNIITVNPTVGTQTVTITPTLSGKYTLTPFTLTILGSQVPSNNVPPVSSTPPSTTSTPPTAPNSTVTGSIGQVVTTAVLGNNGNQIQITLPGNDVTNPIKLVMQALSSLPTTLTSLNGVLQAIDLSANFTSSSSGTPSSTSTPAHYFSHPVTITFTLSAPPTTPIAIVFWNPLTKSWQPMSSFSVNQNTITMTTTHLTTFAVVNASSVQSVNRIEGQTAIDTSIQAAQSAYPDGASSAVLAFTGNALPSPDALSAAGLAGALHAPLLLTKQNQLDPAVLQAIQALGVKTVYVLGGKQAIGDAVVNALTQAGLTVDRSFEGQTLYDTSMMIDQYMYQNKLTTSKTVFIANGQTMIDALSASPVAYQQGAPIMLVKTGQSQLTAGQLAFLQSNGINNAVLLGGNYVVSPGIASQLTQSLGAANVSRLGGKTMNDTAVAIDQHYFPNAVGAVVSSNGTPSGTFVDALSASAFAANNNVPILLTNQDGLPTSTTQYLAGQTGLHAIWVMGGPQAVVASLDQTLSANIKSTN